MGWWFGSEEERFIRNTLRLLSRQRVQPAERGDQGWVMDGGPRQSDPRQLAALRTCHLRGWVEIVSERVPFIEGNAQGVGPLYRVTEGGWQALHRLREWVVATCLVAVVTLVVTIVTILLQLRN